MTPSFPPGTARLHHSARAPHGARAAVLALSVLVLAGCASGPRSHPDDPLEPYNRGMTRFNDAVDSALLKPVATAYQQAAPAPVRTGVSNFFANLGDAWSFVNNTLQLHPEGALSSFFRFNINTLMGLGGVLDVASEMGIERHKQDFGLTLGRWGMQPGPYLVLPILGPSTVRDTLALPVDWRGDPVAHINGVPTRNSLYALRAVDARSNLLRASEVLDGAALDKYSFMRDVFLQVRRQRVEDAAGLDAPRNGDDGRLPPEPDQ